MHNTLPVHPLLGTAIGWRKARPGEDGEQPVWPVMGAAGPDDDDAAADQGDDDTDDTGDDDKADKSDDDTDDKDGDDDKDWKAEYEAQKRINRNLERRTKRDQSKIKELEKSGKAKKPDGDDDDKDLDKAREQAKEEARAELLRDRVQDKIEAKARKFVDSEDAAAVLLRNHEIDDFIDDGKIDTDAIADALDELAENKPHLVAAQGGKRFGGGADGGPRKKDPKRAGSLSEAVSARYQ